MNAHTHTHTHTHAYTRAYMHTGVISMGGASQTCKIYVVMISKGDGLMLKAAANSTLGTNGPSGNEARLLIKIGRARHAANFNVDNMAAFSSQVIVCMHPCMRECVHMCMGWGASARHTHTCILTCIYTCIYIYIYHIRIIFIYAHTYICHIPGTRV